MRMAIFAHGGPGIGGGHIARTAALAEWLAEDGRFSNVTLTWDCPPVLIDVFRPARCPWPIAASSASFIASLQASSRSVDDVVIVLDTLAPDPGFTAALAAMRPAALVHLNDSCGSCGGFDLVFDSDPATAAPLTDACQPRFFRGPEFAILHPSISALRPRVFPDRDALRTVIIALGAGENTRASGLAQAIRDRCPGLEVIVGPQRKAGASPAGNSPFPTLEPPAEYRRRLATADLAITQGGNTAFEAMALGVPCIVLPHPRFLAHTAGLAHAGLAMLCDAADGISMLADVISRYATAPKRLMDVAAYAFRKVDGHGALRVIAQLACDHVVHAS